MPMLLLSQNCFPVLLPLPASVPKLRPMRSHDLRGQQGQRRDAHLMQRKIQILGAQTPIPHVHGNRFCRQHWHWHWQTMGVLWAGVCTWCWLLGWQCHFKRFLSFFNEFQEHARLLGFGLRVENETEDRAAIALVHVVNLESP